LCWETERRFFAAAQNDSEAILFEGLPGVKRGPDTKGHQEKVAGDKEHPQQEEPKHLFAVKTSDIHRTLLPSSNRR
jgi:hypothetical protein